MACPLRIDAKFGFDLELETRMPVLVTILRLQFSTFLRGRSGDFRMPLSIKGGMGILSESLSDPERPHSLLTVLCLPVTSQKRSFQKSLNVISAKAGTHVFQCLLGPGARQARPGPDPGGPFRGSRPSGGSRYEVSSIGFFSLMREFQSPFFITLLPPAPRRFWPHAAVRDLGTLTMCETKFETGLF